MTTRELVSVPGIDGPLGLLVSTNRTVWLVDPVSGSDGGSGTVCATIGGAIGKASPGDVIAITGGSYAENLVIPSQKPGLTLVGLGGLHAGDVAPDAGVPLTVHASDTTIINMDLESPDTSTALVVDGARFRAYRCKIEGGTVAASIGPKTVANGGRGGDDALFDDCEFAWANKGLQLEGTDYGAATQIAVRRCKFHNLAVACLAEHVGSGGSAAITFRNLEVVDCTFDNAEDGTAPTKYVDLGANNGNTGVIGDNRFATATNAASKLGIGTGVKWVRNATEAGSSAARPA